MLNCIRGHILPQPLCMCFLALAYPCKCMLLQGDLQPLSSIFGFWDHPSFRSRVNALIPYSSNTVRHSILRAPIPTIPPALGYELLIGLPMAKADVPQHGRMAQQTAKQPFTPGAAIPTPGPAAARLGRPLSPDLHLRSGAALRGASLCQELAALVLRETALSEGSGYNFI